MSHAKSKHLLRSAAQRRTQAFSQYYHGLNMLKVYCTSYPKKLQN